MNREQTALCLNRQHRRSDGQQEGAERDWTKQYRLAAGVYVMRGGQILMLERARGMMTGFWSVPGGIVDPEGGGGVRLSFCFIGAVLSLRWRDSQEWNWPERFTM